MFPKPTVLAVVVSSEFAANVMAFLGFGSRADERMLMSVLAVTAPVKLSLASPVRRSTTN